MKAYLLGIGDWGLGIGDWGLGVGGQPPTPQPQPPKPQPQEILIFIIKKNIFLIIFFLD